MKTCEVMDLTKSGKVIHSLSLALAVLEVQFGKSKSFKWKRGWGEHSLHCFKKWSIGHKIIVVVLSWLN